MKQVKYLLIGYGYWGPNVARNINNSPVSDLKIIIDSDKKAIGKAKSKNIAEVYLDNSEKLTDKLMADIDVIVITTPPSSHYKLISSFAKYKKTFLIAKPVCRSISEVEKIKKIIEKYNIEIFTDETFIYSNKVKAIKNIVNSKDFGSLNYISSVRSNLGLIQKDIDVIWDLAPHDLSIVSYITNQYPITSKSVSSNALGNVKSQNNIAFIEFDYKKFNFYLNVNWLSPEKVRYMVFSGTKQTVVYDDNKKYRAIKIYDQSIDIIKGEYIYNKSEGRYVNYSPNEPLYDEIYELSKYIISGEKRPVTTFENSKKNIYALGNIKKF